MKYMIWAFLIFILTATNYPDADKLQTRKFVGAAHIHAWDTVNPKGKLYYKAVA